MSEKTVRADTLKKGDWILAFGNYLGQVTCDYVDGETLWIRYPDARGGRGQTIGELVAPGALVSVPELEDPADA